MKGDIEFLWETLSIRYVMAKYELAKYVVEKVGKGQRLCNLGPRWTEEGMEELMQ